MWQSTQSLKVVWVTLHCCGGWPTNLLNHYDHLRYLWGIGRNERIRNPNWSSCVAKECVSFWHDIAFPTPPLSHTSSLCSKLLFERRRSPQRHAERRQQGQVRKPVPGRQGQAIRAMDEWRERWTDLSIRSVQFCVCCICLRSVMKLWKSRIPQWGPSCAIGCKLIYFTDVFECCSILQVKESMDSYASI